MNLFCKDACKKSITVAWDSVEGACTYEVYWSDALTDNMVFKKVCETKECEFTLNKSTHIPHYFYVTALKNGTVSEKSEILKTKVTYKLNEQLEKLNRGLIAVKTGDGIFLSWRMFKEEATGATPTGLTGTDYKVFKNGKEIALVTDSTNYLDKLGTNKDEYQVAPVSNGNEGKKCDAVKAFAGDKNYIEIPMQIPEGGVTPAGQEYTYSVNDMSIGDVDGDGELEYFVKWDPSNSHDVSHKGYTGNCYIDCYKLDGRLLWRLDMGVNIRSGAHYTEFVVFDFNGDGKAEMSVKTAPGTKITRYDENGNVTGSEYITLLDKDIKAGVKNTDNYVWSAKDYYDYLVKLFMNWESHSEVVAGNWPKTLEECFGIPVKYKYPLSKEDACALVDYFMDEFAPSRSPKNNLREFEGFILEGPEYLTMFSGDGHEIETIDFPVHRDDDGMMWGDYAWNRIEPGNRVDRFHAGVGFLDGERPYLIVGRGYYTRATITAYDFFENKHHKVFGVDSGYVLMDNPFMHHKAEHGTDPVYGIISGQGDHSFSVADVDGDGCQEIIYGAATIDHDGKLLYSTMDKMPDGELRKLGHGDSMHVANIDPDRPGFEIFNVFEGGRFVPYGWALRDAETGKVIFGDRAEGDLGRCMIGDIKPDVRGIQVWAVGVYDAKGNKLDEVGPGTDFSIKWAADLSTQVLGATNYVDGAKKGVVYDFTHGVMLSDEETAINNGTKGNPCLVADIFGDHREEIILRKSDNSAIRIYTNTEISKHKLFTLLHDTMYRCGVAWQQNVYNQPCYTSFYYASDMNFENVLRELQ